MKPVAGTRFRELVRRTGGPRTTTAVAGSDSQSKPFDYDVLIIGSGPSGHKAAIQAAKLRKRVAIVEFSRELGGVSINTGTIPSKSFREAVIYLTGFRERSLYGSAYRVKSRISMSDLTYRISNIVQHENQVIEHQLRRNQVDIIQGYAKFVSKNEVAIEQNGSIIARKTAEFIVLAVGTRPYHPPNFEVDHQQVLDSDDILTLKEIPRNLTVVGGGIIGCEYASWFAVLGLKVTLIEARPTMLDFVDREIVEMLMYQFRDLGMTLRVGEEVSAVTRRSDGQIETLLKSGKKVVSDTVLVSAGRQGATDKLGLENIGVTPDAYGRISVNKDFQTSQSNVYAVGDVIGFPSLASSGMRQGRHAALHMFNVVEEEKDVPPPFGIWTIPEVALVGETEASLTEKQVPYEIGVAKYKEIARGLMIGDETGMLKILFHRETRQILGVHIIGEGAIEIVHLGQAALYLNGGLEYLISGVYNYPTLAECYQVAALDGFNRIKA